MFAFILLCADEKKGLSSNLKEPGCDFTEIDETANIYDLDDYLELLYEGVPEKLRGSALILQLSRNPDNLDELFNNGICLEAIVSIFFITRTQSQCESEAISI